MAGCVGRIRGVILAAVVACCLFAGNAVGVWAQEGSAAAEQKLVNPNSAGVEMLAKIPGLDEKIAKEIIVLREQMGDFQNLDDLLEVKGMTKELLEKVKPYISLDPLKTDCSC